MSQNEYDFVTRLCPDDSEKEEGKHMIEEDRDHGLPQPALLATKLAIPPIYARKIVPRPRLYQLLDAGVERPLTLVTAPAGFGKTTLIGEWLRQRARPVAWVSLERSDNDLQRFWLYLVSALDKLHHGLDEQLAFWQQETQSLNIEALLTTLVNLLAEDPQEFVLVLDDYHTMTASIHESLNLFIEYMPPQVHLIITTRSEPPLSLARLRVQGRLIEVRAHDLRFTESEATTFLVQTMGLTLSLAESAELGGCTEGWVAGLQLAALSLQGRTQSASVKHFIATFAGTNRHVLRYLTEEVFASQSVEVQDFLLATSVLERLNAGLCDAVTGQKNSREMLERLEHANLFLIALDEQENNWYRYYHLFADLLHHRLKLKSPTQAQEYNRRASVWYEEQGMMVEAVKHAFAAGDEGRSADLLERYTWPLIRQGDDALVNCWLKRLPEESFVRRPSLSYLRAWTYFPLAQMDECERSLAQAEQIWRVENNGTMLGRIYDLRASMAIFRNNGELVLQHAQQALTLAPAHDLRLRGSAQTNLGASYYLQGDIARALPLLLEGYRTSQKARGRIPLMVSNVFQARVHIVQGTLRIAEQILLQILSDVIDNKTWYPAGAHIRLAEIYCEWNDIASAEEHWRAANSLVEQSGREGLVTAERHIIAARLAWVRDDYEQVITWLNLAEQHSQRFGDNPALRAEIMALRVHFLLTRGEIELARQLVDQSGSGIASSPYASEADALMRARLALALDHPREAIALLETVLETTLAQGRYGSAVALLALLVLVYHAEGDTTRTLQTLERALLAGQTGRYVRVFVDEGPLMAVILTEFYSRFVRRPPGEARDVALDYLEEVLLACGQGGPSLTPQRDDLPSGTLSEREYSVLSLIAEGLSNQEIAQQLVVSVSTIKTHLNNIYAKLQVHTRLQAVTKAYEIGLLSHSEMDTEPLLHPDPRARIP